METLKKFARELSNCPGSDERWIELTMSQQEFCRTHDIVVVYGYSDDNVEFDGAIREEVGAWEGAEIYVARVLKIIPALRLGSAGIKVKLGVTSD